MPMGPLPPRLLRINKIGQGRGVRTLAPWNRTRRSRVRFPYPVEPGSGTSWGFEPPSCKDLFLWPHGPSPGCPPCASLLEGGLPRGSCLGLIPAGAPPGLPPSRTFPGQRGVPGGGIGCQLPSLARCFRRLAGAPADPRWIWNPAFRSPRSHPGAFSLPV